jgi:hypothetical protein
MVPHRRKAGVHTTTPQERTGPAKLPCRQARVHLRAATSVSRRGMTTASRFGAFVTAASACGGRRLPHAKPTTPISSIAAPASELASRRSGQPSLVASGLAAFIPDVKIPPFQYAVGFDHGLAAPRTRARTGSLLGSLSDILRVCGIHRPVPATDAPRPARSNTRDGLGAPVEDRSYQPNCGHYRSAVREMPAGFSSYRPARCGGPLKALRIRPLRRWIAGYFSFSAARISLETANAVP